MPGTSIFSEKLIEEIRSRFVCVSEDMFSGKRIYFENAGLTQKFELVNMTSLLSIPNIPSFFVGSFS